MATRKNSKRMKVKKILRRELSIESKYKTTYSDIKKYFNIINETVFHKKLSPFNDIKIKQIRCKKSFIYGQVVVEDLKRKGTRIYTLEMLPEYKNKKDFVDTLGHEMVHLYQMVNLGDTGNHNKLFYSFAPKLKSIGLQL